MEYSTLIKEMVSEIPEFREIYIEKSKENLVDESSGVYVVIGILFMPYVCELLINNQKNDKSELLERIFAFFERMAQCEDEKVREVLLYTVLENLGDSQEVLKNAKGFMKPITNQMSNSVEVFLGRD